MDQSVKNIERDLKILKGNLDDEFKLFVALWIIFMQCGFALLEAGAVRSKNSTNILFKNFLDVFVGALAYWMFGYGFAYGVPGNAFIGHNFFFSSSVDHRPYITLNVSESLAISSAPNGILAKQYYSSWLFQFAFAATASTIVSGAMAERTQFVAYLLYSVVITGFVYPVVSHWCWATTGFLATGSGTGVRFIDFAGSGVVHVTGGTAALCGAIFLGPRMGKFPKKGIKTAVPLPKIKGIIDDIRGHSVPLMSMGGFVLFTGFLAFNGGSQQTVSGYGDGTTLSVAAVNTVLAGCSGGLASLIFNIIFHHARGDESYWSLTIGINGALAGMVSSCAGSNDIFSWVAVLFGTTAGVLMVLTDHLLKRYRIDDPLGAVPVHLTGGLVGVLLAPIFVMRGQIVNNQYVGGAIYSSSNAALTSIGWNLLGAVCIIAWTGLNSIALFGGLKMTGLLRVSPEEERVGLDIIKHGEPAYPELHPEMLRRSTSNQQSNQYNNSESIVIRVEEDNSHN